MAAQHHKRSKISRQISAKAAYSKRTRKKLIESRARLDGVNAAIQQAVATGRLERSERLERAQRAMELNLAATEARLEELQKSGESEWEQLRNQVDDAWEDLSGSIKRLVAQLSDTRR